MAGILDIRHPLVEILPTSTHCYGGHALNQFIPQQARGFSSNFTGTRIIEISHTVGIVIFMATHVTRDTSLNPFYFRLTVALQHLQP